MPLTNDGLETTVATEPSESQESPQRRQRRGGALAGGGALALGLIGARAFATAAQTTPEATVVPPIATAPPAATAASSPFKNDVDVLNYALTLEHLEATFYRDGLAKFAAQDFVNIGFQPSVRDYVAQIGSDEDAHVQTLTQVITKLGGTPVGEATYNFPYTDLASFLKLAMTIENLGVAAYTGAAQYLIKNGQILTAALTIQGVEGRHAAYLNLLNDTSPFPDAFNTTDTPAEVLKVAGPLIVSSGTPGA